MNKERGIKTGMPYSRPYDVADVSPLGHPATTLYRCPGLPFLAIGLPGPALLRPGDRMPCAMLLGRGDLEFKHIQTKCRALSKNSWIERKHAMLDARAVKMIQFTNQFAQSSPQAQQ